MPRVCVDCGAGFPDREGKGRPFTRCLACRFTHRRVRPAPPETKTSTCADCGLRYAIERGAETKTLRGSPRCPPCHRRATRERQYRWRRANPEKWQAVQHRSAAKLLADPEFRRRKREAMIQRTYGISAEEMARLVELQNGRCAICGRPPRGRPNGNARSDHMPSLHVDHCHASGSVRGLLCGNCNTMIGLANEDPAILAAAIEYLKKE